MIPTAIGLMVLKSQLPQLPITQLLPNLQDPGFPTRVSFADFTGEEDPTITLPFMISNSGHLAIQEASSALHIPPQALSRISQSILHALPYNVLAFNVTELHVHGVPIAAPQGTVTFSSLSVPGLPVQDLTDIHGPHNVIFVQVAKRGMYLTGGYCKLPDHTPATLLYGLVQALAESASLQNGTSLRPFAQH